MKKALFSMQWLYVFFPVLFLCMMHPGTAGGEDRPGKEKRVLFRESIPPAAEKYIGIPYQLGGDIDTSGTLDNSHLFCLIYFEAAKDAGLQFRGYMPMKILLENMLPVPPGDIENGDLMVLQNGHAAMLYNVKDPQHFDLIYTSLKRKQVISFSAKHLAFSAYWLKNLKGYFRLVDEVLTD